MILESAGRASLTLTGAKDFVAHKMGVVTCESAPDGRDVVTITALDLGTLRGGLLRATLVITPSPDSPDTKPWIELWNASPAEGETQPFWRGAVRLTKVTTQSLAGHALFAKAAIEVIDKMPAPVGWPDTLAGEFTWSCDKFAPPASAASPPA